MRVLHLINAFQPGGIETWLLRMLAEIPRERVAMDFCCKGADTGLRAEDAKQLGAAIIHCPLRITHTSFVGGILRLLKCGYYDIVHNHLDVTGGPAVWAAKKANVPVISSFHNTHFAPQTWTRLPGVRQLRAVYSKLSINYSLQNSQAITGCSQAVLDHVLPDNQRDARCRLLYYGVESAPRADHATRTAFRSSFGFAPDTPLVLHVGRFFSQKNHPGLLRIFERVQQEIPSARMVLVGDGVLRNEIETQIGELNLQDKVRLLGMRGDVPDIMAASDVLLFPSLHEGLPVVSLESCAYQLPLVGSDIPGTNESIVNGETGLLHDVDDEAGMAQSVVRVLTSHDFADKIRAAAAARIQQHFSREASGKALVKLYEDTLHIRNSRRPLEQAA